MKKLLLILGVGAILVLGALFAIVSGLPDSFSTSRSTEVDASPAEAYAVAADLHDWPEWTFWSRAGDPGATWDFSGEAGAVGHSMKWKGDVWGEGQIVFTGCTPGERLDYELTFWEDGEEMVSTGSIEFVPSSTGTGVTWTMSGQLEGLVARAMGPLMDGVIGPMFETSLEGLATRLEGDGATGG